MKNTFLVALYELDNTTFVSWFCENKLKPEKQCAGKCQMDHIAKEQSQKDAASVLENLQKEIVLFYEPSVTVLPEQYVAMPLPLKHSEHWASAYAYTFCVEQMRPPSFFI